MAGVAQWMIMDHQSLVESAMATTPNCGHFGVDGYPDSFVILLVRSFSRELKMAELLRDILYETASLI